MRDKILYAKNTVIKDIYITILRLVYPQLTVLDEQFDEPLAQETLEFNKRIYVCHSIKYYQRVRQAPGDKIITFKNKNIKSFPITENALYSKLIKIYKRPMIKIPYENILKNLQHIWYYVITGKIPTITNTNKNYKYNYFANQWSRGYSTLR